MHGLHNPMHCALINELLQLQGFSIVLAYRIRALDQNIDVVFRVALG
jgi:hypothetical protein